MKFAKHPEFRRRNFQSQLVNEQRVNRRLIFVGYAVDGPKPTERKLGGLSAAAQVLAEVGEPMTCKAIVKAMFEKKLWNSDGNTPVSTIYSSIIREIKAKGDRSRFRKTGKGMFEIAK